MEFADTRSIQIEEEWELAKILAFARAGIRSVRFVVPTEFIGEFLERAEAYAKQTGMKVRVTVSTPTFERALVFGAGGALAGGALGWAIGGAPAALIGAAAGAATGVIAAHIRISVVVGDNGLAVISAA